MAVGAVFYLLYLVTSKDRLAALVPKVTVQPQSATDGLSPTPARPGAARGDGELAVLSAEIGELKKAVRELQARDDILRRQLNDLRNGMGLTTAALPDGQTTGSAAAKPPVTVTYLPLPREGFGDTRIDVSPIPIASGGPPTRTLFAVELGQDGTAEELKSRWSRLRTQHGDLLAGLEVRQAAAEDQAPDTLRLLAGPFPNAVDAIRLCLRLKSANTTCKETVFAGDKLL